METFVRPAQSQDLDELARLEQEHRSGLEAGVRGGEEWVRDHPRVGPTGWAERLGAPGSLVLVAGVDGVVLGMAAVSVGDERTGVAAEGGVGAVGAVAQVDLVYVHDEARELGLGEELIATVIQWAADVGATWIEAEALPGDRMTKNLFERVGLVARLITVSRRLR